ncbi:MAG TPA: thiamine pyrophosphate-binding protein [Candidatus Methylomirabilis sp.]|nr:thiamine pyrophosphate-binding protein [Candidatus Methylomirabilis sp.]
MTVAEYLVRFLAAQGIRVIFGMPGGHTLPVYDALARQRRVRHVLARHELGAALMADGYARASGEVGVCLVTSGPGVTNALTGIGVAHGDSIPVLLLSSQVPCAGVGREGGYFHEMDQLAATAPLTKWNARADKAGDVPGLLAEGFRRLRSGRPRPVHVEVPADVLAQPCEGPIERIQGSPSPAPEAEAIRRAAELLAFAERPLILAGGGAVGATRELLALAKTLRAPVVTTAMGKGVVPETHPLSAGLTWRDITPDLLGMERLFSPLLVRAEVLLAVGCRFTQLATGNWAMPMPARLVHADVDPTVIGRRYEAAVSIVADAAEALSALSCAVRETARPRRSTAWTQEAVGARAARPPLRPFVETLRQVLPPEAMVVVDVVRIAYPVLGEFPVSRPRSVMSSVGFFAMGHGLPGAIGAKLAFPRRPVVAVAGDGGFLMTGQELATAVQADIPVVSLVVNDGSLTAIRNLQDKHYGRRFAVDLKNPDFAAFARAFGALGLVVRRPADLAAALRRALGAHRPALLDLRYTP